MNCGFAVYQMVAHWMNYLNSISVSSLVKGRTFKNLFPRVIVRIKHKILEHYVQHKTMNKLTIAALIF